jgi:spore coat protein SA
MTSVSVLGPSFNKKLRIGVLLSGRAQFSVYFGGAVVRWTHEVYRRLQDKIDVTVFGFPTDPATRYPLPHETNAWWRVCLALSRVPLVRRFEDHIWLWALRQRLFTYEILHIHNRPQWAPVLRFLGYRGRIVAHLHNDHLSHWSAQMLDALTPHLDALIVCSTYIGQECGRKSKALAEKTHLIFNGVDTQLFSPCEKIREPKTIFFAGQFIPQKGVLELIKAYSRVLRSHPDVKLVIAGASHFGDERETPYIRQVRQHAESIEKDSGVKIQFTGYLHHDRDLPTLFRRATVFTSPSLVQEAFGLVNAEAMACATPVVGTNRGGVPEVLGDGGRTVNPENTLEYADVLDELLSNTEERIHLGRAGYERCCKMFDWSVIAERWLKLLNVVAHA